MKTASGKGIQVLFASKMNVNAGIEREHIVLVPTGVHNDYALNSVFDFAYYPGKKEKPFEGMLKLGFLEAKKNPHAHVRSLLGEKKLINATNLRFFTLLPDMKSYRSLVDLFGSAKTKELLSATHDLVMMDKIADRRSTFNEALETEVFRRSLTRNSEAFFAFMNAGSVLDGLDHEVFDSISKDFEIRYHSESFDQDFRVPISFNFDGLLSSRISTFVGKNGVGKSLTLRNLVESLMTGDGRVTAKLGNRAVFNRLIAIGTAGETANTFPNPRKRSRIHYKLIDGRRSKKSDKFGGLTGLIYQLFRGEERIGKHSRFDIFLETISPVVRLDKIALPLREDTIAGPRSDEFEFRLVLEHNDHIPLSTLSSLNEINRAELLKRLDLAHDPMFIATTGKVPLSSGQVAFLRLAAQLCLHIENGSLVLLDEPETHLHPHLVTDLAAFLSRVLKLTGSVAVVATHSSYLVREIPKNQVLIFSRTDANQIEVRPPRLRTLGSSVGEVSFSIFGDHGFGHLIEELKGRLRRVSLDSKQMRELSQELPSEALMYLENELGIRIESE